MCHHIHVTLSAEERKSVKTLAGIMIPVYASILLAIVAVAALGSAPRSGEMIAANHAPAATR